MVYHVSPLASHTQGGLHEQRSRGETLLINISSTRQGSAGTATLKIKVGTLFLFLCYSIVARRLIKPRHEVHPIITLQ